MRFAERAHVEEEDVGIFRLKGRGKRTILRWQVIFFPHIPQDFSCRGVSLALPWRGYFRYTISPTKISLELKMPGRGEAGQKVRIADACRSMARSLKDH